MPLDVHVRQVLPPSIYIEQICILSYIFSFDLQSLAGIQPLALKIVDIIGSVCMYVFNARERTGCPKRPYWGENRRKSKIMGKYKYIVVFLKLSAPVPMLLQVTNGSST